MSFPLLQASQGPGSWQWGEVIHDEGRAKGHERGTCFCWALTTLGVWLSLGHLFTICDFYSGKLYCTRIVILFF